MQWLKGLVPRLSRPVWLVLFAMGVSDLGAGATVPLLYPYLHEIRGLDLALVGWLVTARAGGAVIGSALGGIWIDRVGAKVATVASLGVGALCTAGIVFVHDALSGAIVLILYGIFIAMAGTGFNVVLATTGEPAERPQTFAVAYLIANVAGAGGAVLSAVLLERFRAEVASVVLYVVDGLTFGVLAVMLAVALEYREAELPASPPEPGARRGYRAVALDVPLRWLAGIIFLLVAVGFSQLQVGIPGLATAEHFSLGGLSAVFAVNMLGVVVLQLPVQRISSRWRRTTSLAVALGIMTAAWALAQLATQFGIGMLIAAGLVFSGAEVLLSPVLSTLVNDLAPAEIRGRYNGVQTMAWTSGWLAGTAVTGALVGSGHAHILFPILILAVALTACAVARLRKRLPVSADQPPAVPVEVQ
ncbi:MFS transporter [Kribbella sp. NPDC004536]|uniref:MFS transporter n=1 Tax=Kribbella sp. NPDC004536 TaxID=3364106 RepID=UPI0036B48D22